MSLAFHYAARSHVGMVRSNNQDSGYAGPHLLAMADGMGGHAGGDIASSVVISALVGLDEDVLGSNEAGAALLRAVKEANEELAARIRADPKLDGMGTTLIAILRARNSLLLAHIGDSRAFLARDGEVTQITKDHSYVQSLVDEGKLTPEEAAVHPQRALVTRVLTGRPEDEPDLVVRAARAGDRYLIASDGLTDYVAADTVREILLGARPDDDPTEPDAEGHRNGPDAHRPVTDPGDVADLLVALALRAGAPDNVTVVIGDVVDDATNPPSTQPQIVGSASIERRGTRPIPVTPAEKAAALSAETSPDERPEVTLAEEEPRSPVQRWLRRLAVAALTLVVLGGGTYAAYLWSQQQFYVGDYQGNVTIFRGVDQEVGWVELSHPLGISEVKIADLPDFYADRIKDNVTRPDEASAAQLVDDLRAQAAACVAARSTGQPCVPTGPVIAIPGLPTPDPTPTSTTTGPTTSAPTTTTTTPATTPATSPTTGPTP